MDTPRGTVSTGRGVELPCCCRGPGVGVGFWGAGVGPAAFLAGWLFGFPVLRFIGRELCTQGFHVFPFPGQAFPFYGASFLPCMVRRDVTDRSNLG